MHSNQHELDSALLDAYQALITGEEIARPEAIKIDLNIDDIAALLSCELRGDEFREQVCVLLSGVAESCPQMFELAVGKILLPLFSRNVSAAYSYGIIETLAENWQTRIDGYQEDKLTKLNQIILEEIQKGEQQCKQLRDDFLLCWRELREIALDAETLPQIDFEKLDQLGDPRIHGGITQQNLNLMIEEILSAYSFKNYATSIDGKRDLTKSKFERSRVPEEIQALVSHRYASAQTVEQAREATHLALLCLDRLRGFSTVRLKDLDDSDYRESLSNLVNKVVRVSVPTDDRTPSAYFPSEIIETFSLLTDWNMAKLALKNYRESMQAVTVQQKKISSLPSQLIKATNGQVLEALLRDAGREYKRGFRIGRFYQQLPEIEDRLKIIAGLIMSIARSAPQSFNYRKNFSDVVKSLICIELDRLKLGSPADAAVVKNIIALSLSASRFIAADSTNQVSARLRNLADGYSTDLNDLKRHSAYFKIERKISRATLDLILESDHQSVLAYWELTDEPLRQRLQTSSNSGIAVEGDASENA